MKGRDDTDQLAYAVQQGRAIYTFNVGHCCQLHTNYLSKGINHSGIIVTPRQRYGVGEQLRKLAALVSAKMAEEMQNHLEFL